MRCDALRNLIKFNAFTYSADMLLPVIDLKQRSTWMPVMKAFDVQLPEGPAIRFPRGTIRFAGWAEKILGPLGVILIAPSFPAL